MQRGLLEARVVMTVCLSLFQVTVGWNGDNTESTIQQGKAVQSQTGNCNNPTQQFNKQMTLLCLNSTCLSIKRPSRCINSSLFGILPHFPSQPITFKGSQPTRLQAQQGKATTTSCTLQLSRAGGEVEMDSSVAGAGELE